MRLQSFVGYLSCATHGTLCLHISQFFFFLILTVFMISVGKRLGPVLILSTVFFLLSTSKLMSALQCHFYAFLKKEIRCPSSCCM